MSARDSDAMSECSSTELQKKVVFEDGGGGGGGGEDGGVPAKKGKSTFKEITAKSLAEERALNAPVLRHPVAKASTATKESISGVVQCRLSKGGILDIFEIEGAEQAIGVAPVSDDAVHRKKAPHICLWCLLQDERRKYQHSEHSSVKQHWKLQHHSKALNVTSERVLFMLQTFAIKRWAQWEDHFDWFNSRFHDDNGLVANYMSKVKENFARKHLELVEKNAAAALADIGLGD